MARLGRKHVTRVTAGALCLALAALSAGRDVEARPQRRPAPEATSASDGLETLRNKINANTVSIISGNITGTYLRYASDIASVLDEGENMRVLPIVGAGAVRNVTDIMFLRGVDMGLVRPDSVEAIRREGRVGDVASKVQYIARLVDDEMHVVAGSDVTDLRQLAGKKVNFDVVGSGTHFSSTLIFERLGIAVERTAYEQAVAYEKLKSGEIAASIFFGGKPVSGVAGFSDEAKRFHLVSVPFDQRLADYYLPATLNGKDYPNLLRNGETVDTLAAPTLLAVFNLSPDNERYRRVSRFIDVFFTKFPEFLKPPRHPKWREVNLSATVPGWSRFKPAQDWLDKRAGTRGQNEGGTEGRSGGSGQR